MAGIHKFTSNLAQQLLDIDLISLLPVGSKPADRAERQIKRVYLNVDPAVMLQFHPLSLILKRKRQVKGIHS